MISRPLHRHKIAGDRYDDVRADGIDRGCQRRDGSDAGRGIERPRCAAVVRDVVEAPGHARGLIQLERIANSERRRTIRAHTQGTPTACHRDK